MGVRYSVPKANDVVYTSNGAKEVARRLRQISEGKLKVENRGAPSKT